MSFVVWWGILGGGGGVVCFLVFSFWFFCLFVCLFCLGFFSMDRTSRHIQISGMMHAGCVSTSGTDRLEHQHQDLH